MRVSIITDKILIIPLFLFIFSTIKTLSFYFDRLLANAAHFREKLGTLHADSLRFGDTLDNGLHTCGMDEQYHP